MHEIPALTVVSGDSDQVVEPVAPPVFISYHSADRAAVLRLVGAFDRRGVEVWFDQRRLATGDEWRPRVNEGVVDADSIVVVVGPKGLGPEQHTEVAIALNRKKDDPSFLILPVLLSGADLTVTGDPLLENLRLLSFAPLDGDADDDVVEHIVDRSLGIEREPRPSTLGPSPYRALVSYQATDDDARLFFGRERALGTLADQLLATGVVWIVGPSGVGKSSLAQAGLRKLVIDGRLAGERADIVVVTPGARPIDALSHDLGDVTVALSDGRDDLAEHVVGALTELARRQPVIIVMDQFEELYARSADEVQRAAFLDGLARTMRDLPPRLRIVVTLRADFQHRVQEDVEFGKFIASHQLLLGPPTRRELAEVIDRPALAAGAHFAPGLVPTILDAVVDQPNALPLLTFVLDEMWSHASGDLLTVASYRAVGGIRRAIEIQGDRTIAPYLAHDRDLVRWLLLRLVERSDGGAPTRRRCTKAMLTPADERRQGVARRLVDALVASRLVATSESPDGPVLQFAHDAVVSAWSTLRGWIEEEPATLRAQRELTAAAAEWDQHDRSTAYLLSRKRLGELDEVFRSPNRIAANEQALVRASVRRSRWKRTGFVTAAVVAAGLVLVATIAVANGIAERNKRSELDVLRLSAEAVREQAGRPDLGLLLAAAAAQRSDDVSARSALVSGLTLDPQPARVWRPSDQAAQAVVVVPTSGDASVLVSDGGSSVLRCLFGTESCSPWLALGPAQVTSLAASPEGHAAAVLASGRVMLGDLTGAPKELPSVTDATVVALHPTTPIIAVGHDSGQVTARQAIAGATDAPLGALPSAVRLLAVDPETRWVAASDGVVVSLLALGSEPSIEALYTGHPVSLAFDEAGRTLFVGDGDSGDIVAFDLADPVTSPPSSRHLAGHRLGPVVLGVGGDRLVSADGLGVARVWDVTTLAEIGPELIARPSGSGRGAIGDHPGLTGAGFLADRTRVVTVRDDGTIVEWDTSGRAALARRSVHLETAPVDLVGDEAGNTFVLAPDGTLLGYDPEAQPIVHIERTVTDPRGLAVGPTGNVVVAGAGLVVVTGDEVRPLRLPVPAPYTAVAMSANGDALAVGAANGDLALVEYPSLRVTRTISSADLRGNGAHVLAAAFSPDGRALAVTLAGRDTAVRVLPTLDGTPRLLSAHDAEVDAVVWSPDGQRLFSAGDDRRIIAWRRSDWESIGVLEEHTDRVTDLAVVPAAGLLASSSQDGTVRLWDLNTLVPIGNAVRWNDEVVADVAAVGSDGAVSSAGQDVVWWDLDEQSWIARACTIANRQISAAEQQRYGVGPAERDPCADQ